MSDYEPTREQEKAIREYLHESIVPLIEQVLVKKLGQAMSYATQELVNPKREWVGLTLEEVRELEKQFEAERVRTSDEEYLVIYPAAYWQWQRAIEAKLKEKNT